MSQDSGNNITKCLKTLKVLKVASCNIENIYSLSFIKFQNVTAERGLNLRMSQEPVVESSLSNLPPVSRFEGFRDQMSPCRLSVCRPEIFFK